MFFSSNSNPDYFIIREIYENDNASEYFESELERALEEKVETIIIEPSRLGDDTAQWIIVGNCLHKTAVISGLGCLCLGLGLPERGLAYFPLGSVSLFCAAIHTVSWQFDPCCKYQVEYDSRQLQRLPLHNLTSSSPVVLVRKNDRRRRILQSVVALSAVGLCSWRFYNWYLRWSFIGAVGHERTLNWKEPYHLVFSFDGVKFMQDIGMFSIVSHHVVRVCVFSLKRTTVLRKMGCRNTISFDVPCIFAT